ncbi:hypothetical protein [Paenibacillus sp. S150]|uniref:hypothetical protein n=1 Tax=Paenibacillus sp. S150 TaxID=2749826 RepID=UPI001C59169F|nr:hypothetical protein [Paenibacillus sp. S150]MBW4084281.1 hypothetical protein [Paenibacillus sp. S150]
MNLMNEQVSHVRYGKGTVASHDGGRITVVFPEGAGEKSFLYPEAFEHHLSISDPGIQKKIMKELKLKFEQTAAEKLRQEQQYVEEMDRLAEEKLASKKTSRRKTPRSTKK